MKLYEETMKSKEIFKGRILKLRVEEVRLLNGSFSEREIITHQGAVAVLTIKKDRIIFVKQYRIAAQKVMTEIPAGLLERGESPKAAAIRECQEEIGYRPLNLLELGEFFPTPGYSSEKIRLFYATEFEYDPKPTDFDEFLKIVEIPLKTAKALFQKYFFTDGKTAAALGYYFSMKENLGR